MRQRLSQLLRAHPRVALALVALTIVGGALRVHTAASPTRYQSVDERSYAQIARTLADRGHYGASGMRDPLRWAPGAPGVFAVAQLVSPRSRGNGRPDVPAAYPVQAAASTATIPATFALAALAGGPAAGLGAAAVIALYPPAIGAVAELLSEPLGTLALVLALIAVALAQRRRSRAGLFGAGVLVGVAVLFRGDLVLLPLVLAVTVALLGWHARGWTRAGLAGGAFAGVLLVAGSLVVLGPWSAFASRQEHRLVAVTTGGGSNLFVGTYLPGEGSIFGMKRRLAGEARRHDPSLRGVRGANIRASAVLDAVAARHPGLARDVALRREGLENLRRYGWGDPVGFARLMAHKTKRTWLYASVGRFHAVHDWTNWLQVVLVLGSVAGLAAGLVRGRRRAPLLLLGATVLYVVAVNALFVAEPRHNLPLMPVLVAAGAAGLAQLRGRTPYAAALP